MRIHVVFGYRIHSQKTFITSSNHIWKRTLVVQAVGSVSRALRRARAGLRNPGRPMAGSGAMLQRIGAAMGPWAGRVAVFCLSPRMVDVSWQIFGTGFDDFVKPMIVCGWVKNVARRSGHWFSPRVDSCGSSALIFGPFRRGRACHQQRCKIHVANKQMTVTGFDLYIVY